MVGMIAAEYLGADSIVVPISCNDAIDRGRLAAALYWVLPNLAQFDVKASVVHGQRVPAGYVAIAIAYAAAYTGVVLTIATSVFSRRDFK